LIAAVGPDTLPLVNGNFQPVVLRYTGANTTKQITAYYDTGLQADLGPNERIHERVALRFIAEDPFWYSVVENGGTLAGSFTVGPQGILRRVWDTGAWNPVASNRGSHVYAVLRDTAGSVWVGGNFTDFDNNGTLDYLARYDLINAPADWEVAGGNAFNAPVFALTEGPNGNIYAGGLFNKAGGGTQDYLARWDGVGWQNVGAPLTGAASITAIYALAFDGVGSLWIGGSFSNLGNQALNDHIARYNPKTDTIGNTGYGFDAAVYALARDVAGSMWLGGDFTQQGGGGGSVNARRVVRYLETRQYDEVGKGLNNTVRALALGADNQMYAGGFFDANGNGSISPLRAVARFNNSVWEPVGPGLRVSSSTGGSVYALHTAPDGNLWMGGYFAETGDGQLDNLDNLAVWTGNAFTYPDVEVGSGAAARIFAIEFGFTDPSRELRSDVYLGMEAAGNVESSAGVTVTHNGTARAYPQIIIRRTAGTGVDALKALRNARTGEVVTFDGRDIENGDTVVLDFASGRARATSQFYGDISDVFSAGTPVSNFYLVPGDNLIRLFIDGTGTYQITIVFRDTYKSYDD